MADKKQNAVKYGAVVAKCWEDEAYKKRFLEDPEAVLSEAGFVLDEGVTYTVIEQPKMVKYIVLPFENAKDTIQLIAKGLLNTAEKKDVIIPEGMEVRMLQNTEDTRYMILPASPKTLTKTELAMVAGGGSVETVEYAETMTTLVSHAEAVTGAIEVQTVFTSSTAAAEVEVALVAVLI
ncbi:MAG: hypothetical protein J6Z82_01045 [Schwartzia sp.]|nr:hypothetical protein [Schwartzia sp. (in: firmicutes)]